VRRSELDDGFAGWADPAHSISVKDAEKANNEDGACYEACNGESGKIVVHCSAPVSGAERRDARIVQASATKKTIPTASVMRGIAGSR
jgi:hypothetical protein